MTYVHVINVPDFKHPDNYQRPRIFLAGPTPRSKEVSSWRPEFIETLELKRFDCTVFVPETADGWWHGNYDEQCKWEHDHMDFADYIAFWIPRDLNTMPAFITNVEFGYWIGKNQKKIFYGRPDDAPKTRYLDWMYETFLDRQPVNNIDDLIVSIIAEED